MSTMQAAGPRWPFDRSPGCPLDLPPQIAQLREKCPISEVRLWDDSPALLLTRYDDVRSALRNPAISSDTGLDGFPQATRELLAMRASQRSFIRMDPPAHDAHRRMLVRDFTVARVATYKPFIEDVVSSLLDDMRRAGPPADIVTALAQRVPSAVICMLLDLPLDDAGFFRDQLTAWMSLESTPEESLAAATALRGYFDRVVDARAAALGDDIISRLIRDHLATGELTRDELLHMLHLLLTGGFDTTVGTIALGTIALLQHPGQVAELQADPGLVPNAVEEVLRYTSVTHHTAYRLARADIDINGHHVPAGAGVIAPVSVANRDPGRFPSPDTFDIHRDARTHVAFGFGLHQCLGQALARLELQVIYAQLFDRLPSLRLAAEAGTLQYTNAMVYGVAHVPVTWDTAAPTGAGAAAR
jgi:cytochrome P450